MRKNQHRETIKEQLVLEASRRQEMGTGGAGVARTAKALQGERHSSQF